VTQKPVIRCAIYTCKSSDEPLDQAFSSLDAQYEAFVAYAASQRHEDWKLIPDRFDDGGLSGGTLERPAHPRRHPYGLEWTGAALSDRVMADQRSRHLWTLRTPSASFAHQTTALPCSSQCFPCSVELCSLIR
jgi:hypothetical protein